MTYTIEADVGRDDSFETAEEAAAWIEELLTEFIDEEEFNLTIINDLQTGDSG